MPLSPADEELVAQMKQRQFLVKRRLRAADAIRFRMRRFRIVVEATTGVVVAAIVTVLFLAVENTLAIGLWRVTVLGALVGGAFGVLLGQSFLRTHGGRDLLVRREDGLRQKYSGDLYAGRRWLPFYFKGEEVSAYVPHVLYSIEAERRFDSVQAALDFARSRPAGIPTLAERAVRLFEDIAVQTNVVVVSSVNASGAPSSRVMNFVRSDRPGVWYLTTAPGSAKVSELDRGPIALVTVPTDSGAVITSNRVDVRRLAAPFGHVAELYRAQVPGYAEGLNEAEQARELVYEAALRSARVDTWLDRVEVTFAQVP